ncbi:unnamed protein product [Pseudo-nitzschia multistriata]|uniref:GST N-terminal domain-containing protein n=1 Tax=Pseudo-nitzschia multistriata TaxID=183589 RepID=A0A448Z9Z6_9STRA|nr:unnamed protein product [Pseudo-nitzschia multistriata]
MAFKVQNLDLLASRVASHVLRYNVAQAAAKRIPLASASASASTSQPPPPRHELILYDFEGSPWCRLVREYATILDLTLHIRPCPRETLLFGEGAFSAKSRFRPEAMEWFKSRCYRCSRETDLCSANSEAIIQSTIEEDEEEEVDNRDNLTFPLLVDRTNAKISTEENSKFSDHGVVVLTESYDILCHLWKHYGASVVQSEPCGGGSGNSRRRPDQTVNSSSVPFPIRFLSLAGPSYLRPWPRCGLMRFPCSRSSTAAVPLSSPEEPGGRPQQPALTLYQAEGCPESRLVREVLCSLEIPYRSVPVADGSSNRLPNASDSRNHGATDDARDGGKSLRIPLLEIAPPNDSVIAATPETAGTSSSIGVIYRVGARECVDYLRDNFYRRSGAPKHHDDHGRDGDTPTWLDPLPEENLGRGSDGDGSNSLAIGAYTAFLKGSRAFVPARAMK